MNPQHGNVGNLGDILKHAALEALSRLMAAPLTYVDSHAFQLHAPLANPRWREQTAGLALRHPAYRAYEALEGPRVERGEYLCSGGIALARLPGARVMLCERDAGTRARLCDQVARMPDAPVTILEEVAQCCTGPERPPPGPLLALIDPFVFTETDWQAGLEAVRGLHRPGEDGLLEVFGHVHARAIDWPSAPAGWAGPIARIDRSPYHLAVYATGTVGRRAVPVLEGLGWRR